MNTSLKRGVARHGTTFRIIKEADVVHLDAVNFVHSDLVNLSDVPNSVGQGNRLIHRLLEGGALQRRKVNTKWMNVSGELEVTTNLECSSDSFLASNFVVASFKEFAFIINEVFAIEVNISKKEAKRYKKYALNINKL